MIKDSTILSGQNTEGNKKTVWLVDDLTDNHDIFHNALDQYFKTESFYTPKAVMDKLNLDRNVPDALLCDMFFFPDEKIGGKIEDQVRDQSEEIRKLGKKVVEEVLNTYKTWDYDDIVGGLSLGKKINEKYGNSPPFVVFAYTTKGPYLLDGNEFDEVEDQNMHWLLKKKNKLKPEEISLYGEKLRNIINREIENYKTSREWKRDFDYFEQFEDGKSHNFFLIQLDLTNHTKWCSKDLPGKHPARKELAKKITEELWKKYQFHKLFWAGDGGVFVRVSENITSYDVIVDAAYQIYELFDEWKKKYLNLNPQDLGIRVCVHKTDVYAYTDPGLWASSGLNDFLKLERSITSKGFAVAKEIAESSMLSSSIRQKLEGPESIEDKDGKPVMQMYYIPDERLNDFKSVILQKN